MGKVKSIKRTFFWYLPLCVLVACLGAYGIGLLVNELQTYYEMTYSDVNYQTEIENAQIEVVEVINGMVYYDVKTIGRFESENPWHRFLYAVISYAMAPLMVGWGLLCVAVTGIIFYKRELEQPIGVLLDASEKISNNCLDFEMQSVKQNELGQLCQSFEHMRQALYENNQELWRTLEERKRLNAAFSHDIRTPLSVLKGNQEMLQNYVPEETFSKEQLMEMIETMGCQITRLENYTQKMSAVQKLEDIVPEYAEVSMEELAGQLKETGKLLAGERNIDFSMEPVDLSACISIDKELVLEVYENLVSNAARFAESKLTVKLELIESTACGEENAGKSAPGKNAETMSLLLSVEDDGPGFSGEALHRAVEPFYGSEKDGRVHFGLGLYICNTICEKHRGKLVLENRTTGTAVSGGRVTACFGVKETNKISKEI